MVWPFTSSSSSSSDTNSQGDGDPLRDLDPSLRAFLEKESPVKYTVTPPPPPPTSTSTSTTSSKSQSSTNQTTANSQPPPSFPTQFPEDNRYAHLWKTYTPLSVISTAHASPQEKLNDVLAGYKERKASIGRAALENCADEHWAQDECYRVGDWGDRLSMCRQFTRRLERCYVMNTRLLKALGYLSVYERSPEVEEQIQMHADKLFVEMIEREKAVEAAKERGEEAPTFAPLIPRPKMPAGADITGAGSQIAAQTIGMGAQKAGPTSTTTKPATNDTNTEKDSTNTQNPPNPETDFTPLLPAAYVAQTQHLPSDLLKGYRDRLAKIENPVEREIEAAAIIAEVQQGRDTARAVGQVLETNKRERRERIDTGQARTWDWLASLLGR